MTWLIPYPPEDGDVKFSRVAHVYVKDTLVGVWFDEAHCTLQEGPKTRRAHMLAKATPKQKPSKAPAVLPGLKKAKGPAGLAENNGTATPGSQMLIWLAWLFKGTTSRRYEWHTLLPGLIAALLV